MEAKPTFEEIIAEYDIAIEWFKIRNDEIVKEYENTNDLDEKKELVEEIEQNYNDYDNMIKSKLMFIDCYEEAMNRKSSILNSNCN